MELNKQEAKKDQMTRRKMRISNLQCYRNRAVPLKISLMALRHNRC